MYTNCIVHAMSFRPHSLSYSTTKVFELQMTNKYSTVYFLVAKCITNLDDMYSCKLMSSNW